MHRAGMSEEAPCHPGGEGVTGRDSIFPLSIKGEGGRGGRGGEERRTEKITRERPVQTIQQYKLTHADDVVAEELLQMIDPAPISHLSLKPLSQVLFEGPTVSAIRLALSKAAASGR